RRSHGARLRLPRAIAGERVRRRRRRPLPDGRQRRGRLPRLRQLRPRRVLRHRQRHQHVAGRQPREQRRPRPALPLARRHDPRGLRASARRSVARFPPAHQPGAGPVSAARPRTVRRVLAIAALTLAGLLLLTVLAVAWLLGTESGLRFAFARAAGYLPGGVEIGAVDGTASGPLLVQDVRVQAPGFSLALDRLELEWRLSGLLKREIRIERLYADGLCYAAREQPPPPEEDKEPFRLPERIDLPVDVFADDVRVRDIAVRGSAEAEPLVVDEVALVAQWTGRAAEIETLRIQAPLADAQAHASLVPRGDYPLEAELAYTVRPPDLAPLSGSTRLDGNLERLRLLQTLAAPYNLRLEATARDVLDELGFDATLEVTQAHVAHIAGNLPPADVTLRLEASGGLDAVRVELDARGSEPEIGAVDVELAGEVSPELIAIERLTANLANGRIDGGGRIELGGQEPRVDIGAEWSALQWPLQGNPRVASEKGRLEVKGTLEDYRARLDAALRVPNQADGHVTLAGTGNDRSFQLGTIEIATLEGTLQGAGEVAWTPVLGGRIDLA